MPILRKAKKPILTFSFSADSITIRLAIAPIIVALPAKVDAEAKLIHKTSLSKVFIRGNISTVKGTLLTI